MVVSLPQDEDSGVATLPDAAVTIDRSMGDSSMGAGAYSVDINPAGELVAAGTTVRRVVPIPPPQSGGSVKYGDVYVSLAANAPVVATVTILTQGAPDNLPQMKVPAGRASIMHTFVKGDLAVDVSFTPSPGATNLAALVEYIAL